ncbi:NADH-ubiquinone oxidoreductase-F iron-sulfur binding region domain-containing protein [Rhodoferax sp.]|uniref:NADH-ubiquinone oxidoreductase-F iron-sulfur binding region domain-containing protein n=1 Tax=Rhodoferax sp. TaxID=50421 RepID=UPI00262B53CD|nr:NADH-ubiquinone oxidoreductase-F iron-sulfur binding region domain-containing protein [Rhodoferax sp.]MDD5480969.1 NADH-ubiquinone oxidoreductase-F iron-sulfur binding region domain-containing protein [Rhodoferax sp.]
MNTPPSVTVTVTTTATLPLQAVRERLPSRNHLKGRQPEAAALAEVRALIGPAPHPRDLLIEHLHRLNDHYRGLFERHLVALAHEMRLSMVEVFEVASFYHHFQVLPDSATAPPLTVRVCDGLSCQMTGAHDLHQHLSEQLKGMSGAGAAVRLLATPCVGRCEQAPVAVVHQCPLPQASTKTVIDQVNLALAQAEQAQAAAKNVVSEFDIQNQPAAQHPPAQAAIEDIAPSHQPGVITGAAQACTVAPDFIDLALYRRAGGYTLATELAAGTRSHESVLVALENAGLRGLGGAGFPAGRKWRIVREQPAPRLMAVNIDEGEPGTFKDRTYLERDPHRFLEGLLVAAQVVGIQTCYIYLRDEYHGCRALLQAQINALQANPPCPLPKIELRRGAGAYICGEESAMIESLEGKRGEPRLRPPYIAQVGLFGRPTLEHNFETLFWVRDIVQRGPDWFTGFGRHGRTGLRSFSVSGRVREPGVKLAPAGITLRELVDEFCGGMAPGHTLYAYLPGGASGGIFPASLADVPLDFDTLQPHGGFIGSAAVIVLSQHDSARDAALAMMQFFAHESCGQCTPCRLGTDKAATLMAASIWDEATLNDLASTMMDASICGLGQAAPNPLLSVLRYFRHELTGDHTVLAAVDTVRKLA